MFPLLLALLAALPSGRAEAQPSVVRNSSNGHYYELVSASLDWDSAKTAAAARTYRGVAGHLATITSPAENGFMTTNFGGTTFWMGAVQASGSAEPSGGFGWITGEPFTYTDWNSGEPNNAGVNGEPPSTTPRQDAIQRNNFNKWNDVPHTAFASFYLVEYDVIVVDTTSDASADTDGVTSLREAITLANNNSGSHNIIFDATAFAAPRKTITVNNQLPSITTPQNITAPAAGVQVTCDNQSIDGLFTVRGGTLKLANLSISSNFYGFAIFFGDATLEGCTLSGRGSNSYGIAAANNDTVLRVRNCTISGMGKTALNISNLANGTLESCTVTGNAVGVSAGSGATLTVSNSLIAGNTTNTSGTNNITSGTATEAGLDPNGLQENGGPTQTIALVGGSPAINTGATALSTDQRGKPRPYGTADDIGAFEVQNTVPALGAVTLLPDAPKTRDILTANFTITDGDSDPLAITYVWKKNGEAISGQSGNTLNLASAGNGDKNDSISITVTVSDGKEAGTVSVTSAPVIIGNSAPVVSDVTIDQSAPKTNDTLSFSIGTLTDADGDTLTPAYQWQKNDVDIQGQTGATLDLSVTGNGDKGDKISVIVTASDGTVSTNSESPQVTIGNTAPSVTSVTITPSAPLTSDLLTATVVASDVDASDTSTYTYEWRKNGELIAADYNYTEKLDLSKPGVGDDGDSITVTVTANDGLADSTPKTSDPVTISNRSPRVDSVSPQNESDKVGAKRSFTLTTSDANGADDIREMWLLINTQLDWSAGATLIYRPSASDPTTGQLFLRRGDDFLPPITIGSGANAAAVLDNGAVRVVAGDVTASVSADGNAITLTLPATIRDGLVGQNTLFARVQDGAGAVDPASFAGEFGFVRSGPYTVTSQFSGTVNSAPTLSNLSPGATYTTLNSSGIAPNAQNFGFFVKDEQGIGDIDSVWFLANKTRGWTNSATFVYYPRTRRLVLRSDDGNSFLGGGIIGTPGIIENSQVKVDLSKVKLTVIDGKSFGLTLPLQAKTGLIGSNSVWLRVQDLSGTTSLDGDDLGFVRKGTWNVKANTGADSKPSAGNS